MFTNQHDALNGDLQDLIAHLEAQYRAGTQQPAGTKLQAQEFIDWARRYLSLHRPSEVFPVDNNYGIMLTNGQRIKLCPGTEEEPQRSGGDMANPDNSISLTRPRS